MLSLHRNTGLEHPWFARPVMNPTYTRGVPHRQHHEFMAVSDESASASTTSTEEYSIYKSYKSSNNKKVSESRPRSATQQTYGDYLDLPSGKTSNQSNLIEY